MALNTLGGLNGLNGLNTLGGSSQNQNITPEELLMIAQSQGGAVGSVAEELAHPNRGILSSVSQGFKNIFKGFIDVISLPGEIVSGTISKDYTIKEAIEQHKTISDAIFGSEKIDFNGDGNETTMEKVGNFIVRTPFDILLDPTTYLTFGAGASKTLLQKMGLSLASNSKVSLLKEGKIVTKSLSDFGQEGLTYAKKYVDQASGKIAADNMIAHGLETGALKKSLIANGVKKEEIDFIEQNAKALLKSREKNAISKIASTGADLSDDEFKALLKDTLEAPLDIDMSKKIMSNLMEHSPGLIETMIDKGGIKFMGKTILSAQRIASATQMIPGMNFIDEVTLPLRNAILAPFDAGLVKTGGKYVRIPEEFLHLETQLKDLTQARKVAYGNNLDMLKKALKLNSSEIDGLMTAINTAKMPSDARLGKAYLQLQGMQEKDMQMFIARGIPKGKLDMYVGNVLLPNDIGKSARNGTFRSVPSTAEHATHAKLIQQSEMPVMHNNDTIAKAVTENLPKDVASEMAKIKSPQELAYAVGKQKDALVNKLTKAGMTMEDAIKEKGVKALDQLRDKIDAVDKNPEVVGKLEAMGFTPVETADKQLVQYWKDNESRVYKRVAATAQELEAVGIEGFDTDLLTSFVFRGMKNMGQLTAHDFMDSLVRDFGKWSKEAPPGWVELSSKAIDDKTAMLAKGLINESGDVMKFHPAIAARFDDTMKGLVMGDEATSDFLKGYDQLLKYWKGSMTSIFPMFHGRNAISNVFQNYLDIGLAALDPRKHFTAIQVMNDSRKLDNLAAKALGTGDEALAAAKEMSELLNKKFMTDATGHAWTVGELRDVIKKNNIALTKNNLGYMDIADRDKLLTKIYQKEQTGVKATAKKIGKAVTPLNDDFLGFKAGKWVGGGIEDQARILNFVSNLMNTGDVAHAATRTKMFLFDYGNLTRFEKNFMRRIIPFYTWTRKNLELQFKTFMHAPGRVGAEVKTIKNLGSIFDGEPLTDEEQKLVPVWLKNSLNLKIKDKDGKSQLLTGFGLPIEQAFQQFTGAQILGSVSPLIRFPIEKTTGYQWFRGKPTSEVIDASNYKHAPQALKDFIGYSEYRGTTKDGKEYNVSVSLRPEHMMTIQNMPFSRIINTLGNLGDQSQSDALKAIQAATGVRTFNFDEQLLEQRKQDELRKALEKILTDAGIRGEFIRYYTKKNTTQVE